MCQFLETIRIEQGRILHLEDHEERMNRTRNHFWPETQPLSLRQYISPEEFSERTRCRIVYDRDICSVSYFPYQPRLIQHIRMIQADGVDYSWKSADRSVLDEAFRQRGSSDEVLLVRQGLITDTSIANVAFWDGSQWYTPDKPLLAGTHRSRLLRAGILMPADIRPSDLIYFQKICLFNAMLDFEEVVLPVGRIDHTAFDFGISSE